MDVNRNAPVVVALEVFTHAAPITMWHLHTDIDRWSNWNPHIARANLRAPLRVGTTFDWFTGGSALTSTIGELVPPRRIAWGGRTQDIDRLHVWTFTPQPGGTLVRAEESWDGEPVRADPANLRTALEASLRNWLGALKQTAETGDLPPGGTA